ncbi:uncharacterized protein LOC111708473 isoform X2 [Eurytemora carolleeae]|uniref:uncharacterized protein LOC111708473 isoform X2 n=1 Tax=Eurytemora carolleeae TaxID=1294199 RepID=UPI000C75D92A|nr:uncharacterized protein LOC111708473 isoform X2 [Eurytemora carolleeae]|eukprot:XP_023337626.1 uncharacterized protein LOC111708473 isoform X2 [Eurytemora affinis]
MQTCDFEWRRKQWNITMRKCSTLNQKVKFIGSYTEFECGIEISEISRADLGIWKCQMEQYVFGGSLGSGKRGENRFQVYSPTTTTTTTTTTSTSTRAPARRNGRMLNVDIPISGIKSIPSNGKTMLAEVFRVNLISGCVSGVVILIFLILFAALVYRHKKLRSREPSQVMETLPIPRKLQMDLRQKNLKTKTEKLNQMTLSPTSTMSRRTSLSSVVPSIEDDNINKDDIVFMMKIFPHLITLSDKEGFATIV